jgi:uncharacterized protein YaiI (UPF0178 family)
MVDPQAGQARKEDPAGRRPAAALAAGDLDEAQPSKPNRRRFTGASIGAGLASRGLLTALREAGEARGGGRAFGKQDRSRFLGALGAASQAIRRTGR